MKLSEIFQERDPTQGSLVKTALLMTWPLWLNSAVWIVSNGLNIYWISQIGSQALAAVVAGGIAFMLMMTLIQGLVTATYGQVGHLTSSQDKAELQRTAREILLTGLCLSLIIAFFGFLLAPILLRLIGAETEVLSLATTYLRIQVLGGIVSFSLWIINGIMRAARDMVRPMIIVFIMIVLNTAFDWLLILGNLGFPKMGVAGAAIASAVSASIGALIGFWVLFKGNSPIKISIKSWCDLRIRIETLKGIIVIAKFHTLELTIKVVIDLILLNLIAFWGITALAAYSIGHRLLRMTSVLGIDLAVTTAIIVSNNLGSRETERAEKAGWINTGLNVVIMGTTALTFFIFAENVMNFYSRSPEVIAIGIKYLKITTPAYIFLAVTVILSRAFAGAKNTKIPAIVALTTYGVIQLSLAKCLPAIFNIGISGIWLAILIATIAHGLILIILFKSGAWKKKSN